MPRMTCRRLPVVAFVLALVLAAPAGAGDSPLAKRLARALEVPHVSQARTGAVFFWGTISSWKSAQENSVPTFITGFVP